MASGSVWVIAMGCWSDRGCVGGVGGGRCRRDQLCMCTLDLECQEFRVGKKKLLERTRGGSRVDVVFARSRFKVVREFRVKLLKF